MSVEPSMEEILSSIKRIIAEEEAPTGRRRATRPSPPAPVAEGDDARDEDDEVLELSDPIPAYPQAVPAHLSAPAQLAPVQPNPVQPAPVQEPTAEAMPAPTSSPARAAPTAAAPTPKPADPIVSPAAVDATRGALDSLSRLLVKPDPNGDGTLEGLVRDMLRPMLKDWLDANLPDMVEAMVSREIARISGQGR